MRISGKQIAIQLGVCWLLQMGLGAHAQDLGSLQGDQSRIKSELKAGEKALASLNQNVAGTLKEVRLLEGQIGLRQELLQGMHKQVAAMEKRAAEQASVIDQLGLDLETSRKDYAQLIQWVYHQRASEKKLLFILSSSSWSQAYKRIQYLLQLTHFRQQQAEIIQETKASLQQSQKRYEKQLLTQQTLLEEQAAARKKMEREQHQMQTKVNRLRKDRTKVKRELAEMKARERKIARLIKKIRSEQTEATSNTALAKLWKKLRRPVSGGVSRKFGKWRDKVTGTDWFWNGIDISAARKAEVQSVCAGEVRMVEVLPGKGLTVLVRSGEYVVVYANLNAVTVEPGDRLEVGSALGKLALKNNQSTLHFQIWKGDKPVDPELWFAP